MIYENRDRQCQACFGFHVFTVEADDLPSVDMVFKAVCPAKKTEVKLRQVPWDYVQVAAKDAVFVTLDGEGVETPDVKPG